MDNRQVTPFRCLSVLKEVVIVFHDVQKGALFDSAALGILGVNGVVLGMQYSLSKKPWHA
jgi:hypothetical protein